MSDYSFLHLPQHSPEMAKQGLADYLLNADIPAIATTTEDGCLQYSMPVGRDTVRIIQDVIYATVPWAPENPERFIDWTPPQALEFLNKVEGWWRQEKGLLEKAQVDEDLHNDVVSVFEVTLELFARVILPRIPRASQPTAIDRALTILKEMEDAGIPLLGISPTLLFVDPSLEAKISKDLQLALANKNETTARRAIFAIQSWALLPLQNDPPVPISPGLIEDIVDKIFLRAQPELASTLGAVADMVEHVPMLFHAGLVEKLLDALRLLAVETEIIRRGADVAGSSGEHQIAIELEERPAIRRYAAILASQLFGLVRRSGQALSPVLKTWEAIGQNDVLPEVRRAWNHQV
jgi:hypothetical protein